MKKMMILTKNTEVISSQARSLFGGQDRYPYLTVLCDHEYMRGIQEKIRLIHAFQKDEKSPVV